MATTDHDKTGVFLHATLVRLGPEKLTSTCERIVLIKLQNVSNMLSYS